MSYVISLRGSVTLVVNGSQSKYFKIECILRENIKIKEDVLSPPWVAIFIEHITLKKEWEDSGNQHYSCYLKISRYS